MERIKMGIIGCGFPFYFHTDNAENSPYVEYTAVHDLNYDLAREVAEGFSANEMTAYKTLDELLASDIDAVLVSVPHDIHEEIVEKCCEAGKHVLCEKPMAMTVEGCRKMIADAERCGVRLMIAENHRFLPIHNAMREAVAKGLVGNVCLVRSYEGCNEIEGNEDPDSWKGDIDRCGGAWLDMSVHKFGALEYILGERVDSVMTLMGKQVGTLPMKGDDNAISIVTFKSGAMAEVTVSSTQVSPANNSMEIFGDKGTILEDHGGSPALRIYSEADEAGDMAYDWDEPEVEHDEFPGYYFISGRNTDDHFARCLLEGTAFAYTLEDAMSAVECALTGYLSFLEKRPVKREELLAMPETKSLYERVKGEGVIPTKRETQA